MGPPANLPGFRELARQVAECTGPSIGEYEPEDRFLRRIKEACSDIHLVVAQRLQQNNPLSSGYAYRYILEQQHERS